MYLFSLVISETHTVVSLPLATPIILPLSKSLFQATFSRSLLPILLAYYSIISVKQLFDLLETSNQGTCHFKQSVTLSCFAFLFLWNGFYILIIISIPLPSHSLISPIPCICTLSPFSRHCGWGDLLTTEVKSATQGLPQMSCSLTFFNTLLSCNQAPFSCIVSSLFLQNYHHLQINML